MQITTEQIVEKIYNGFVSKYKAFGKFVDSGEYWNMCIDAVRDKTLLEHIIFCNDVLIILLYTHFCVLKLTNLRTSNYLNSRKEQSVLFGDTFLNLCLNINIKKCNCKGQ